MTKTLTDKTMRQLGAIANNLGIPAWTRMDRDQRQAAIAAAGSAQRV